MAVDGCSPLPVDVTSVTLCAWPVVFDEEICSSLVAVKTAVEDLTPPLAVVTAAEVSSLLAVIV